MVQSSGNYGQPLPACSGGHLPGARTQGLLTRCPVRAPAGANGGKGKTQGQNFLGLWGAVRARMAATGRQAGDGHSSGICPGDVAGRAVGYADHGGL